MNFMMISIQYYTFCIRRFTTVSMMKWPVVVSIGGGVTGRVRRGRHIMGWSSAP